MFPRAKKSYGQHFLRDASVLQKIVEAAQIVPEELVLEVGPGTGALTTLLAAQTAQLVLVEADKELVPKLQETFSQATIVQADAAAVDYDALTLGKPWILIGNLPYNVASAILMQALKAKNPPRRLVIMVQREVGERMLAVPGAMSLLAVATQLYTNVERVCVVKPGAFVPPPKVDSMVVRLTLRGTYSSIEIEHVLATAKVGFAKKRKQLQGNLFEAGLAPVQKIKAFLVEHGYSAQARAEQLAADDWVVLSKRVSQG